ncbi:MAG: hypothetical protein LBD44_05485 [Spirochaetaceae bacterium]|jgi:hypothetical protein|nr:hypothetical protein [Spirochaetaceae bacterium]
MTRKKTNTLCVALVISIITLILASCDDSFSKSWGKSREYDQSKINLTMDNLREWKEKATGNPDLEAALVGKIIGELDSKSGAEKAAFQDAGIELAIGQSGIGMSIIELAGKDISNIKDEATLKDILGSVQGKFSSSAAAGNIAKIVNASIVPGATPKFADNDLYALNAEPSDVGIVVAALTLAVAPDIKGIGNLKDALSGNDSKLNFKGKQVTAGNGASQEEIALAAYLNLIANDKTGKYKKSPMVGSLKKAFNL